MFCQICGARIPEGRSACVQCGAPAGRLVGFTPAATNLSLDVRSCPRCGYHGSSQAYFASGVHLLALLGMTAFFTPIAGVIYFMLRNNHRMCPSCGLDWGKHAMLAVAAPGSEGAVAGQIPPEVSSMGEGGAKRFFSWLLFAFAALMVLVTFAAGEAVPLGFAMFGAGAGYLLRRSASEDRLRRREAILQSLQRPVLQLAAQRGGRLTVTEVAAEYGWSIPRAEKVLQSLEDGYRVMGDVTEDGVIVFNFLELVPVPGAPELAELPRPRNEAPRPENLRRDGAAG